MQDLPPVLYHYTTQQGLLGILSSNALWATKIHYLNDSAEYQLALDLASSYLTRLHAVESTARSSKRRNKIKALLSNLRMIARMNVCVCSFSVHRDRLSQWRAYGGGVAGYAVGFHTEAIARQASAQGFHLARCVYDGENQKRLVEQLVESSLREEFPTVPFKRVSGKPRTLIVMPMGGDFPTNIARLASVLKSSAFHEEDEWRLVSDDGIDVRNMQFRPGLSMLLPYASVALGDKNQYLHSITVGPTPHPALATEAVGGMLGNQGLAQGVTVHASDAPYRAW